MFKSRNEEISVSNYQLINSINELKREVFPLSQKKSRVEQKKKEHEELEMQSGNEEAQVKQQMSRLEAAIEMQTVDLDNTKEENARLSSNLKRIDLEEQELNHKLNETLQKLLEAKVDKKTSERENRMRQALDSMQRIFKGVHGRVLDICQPTQRKYETAVSLILGRHMDSIIVEHESVAIDCIKYMKDNRIGQATFLPLDTLSSKPISDRMSSLGPGVRLSRDVIKFDSHFSKAISFVCGSSVICDTIEDAKRICYSQSIKVRAVTLDGTVIHKTGLMTGGVLKKQGRWEEKQVDALKNQREDLVSRLNTLSKEKRKCKLIDSVEISSKESKLDQLIEEREALTRKISGLKDQRVHYAKLVVDFENEISALVKSEKSYETRLSELSTALLVKKEKAFESFCLDAGIPSIAEYEESIEEDKEHLQKIMEFSSLLSKLTNQ